MSDLFLKFVYSNAAKGIGQLLIAGGLIAVLKFATLDGVTTAAIAGGVIGLLGAALANLGVTVIRAGTDTPRNSPDSKGDTKF